MAELTSVSHDPIQLSPLSSNAALTENNKDEVDTVTALVSAHHRHRHLHHRFLLLCISNYFSPLSATITLYVAICLVLEYSAPA